MSYFTPLTSVAVFVLLSINGVTARAEVQLPSIFGDQMVLQRDATVAVWGKASPGEEVTVHATFLKQPSTTTANDSGQFSVRFSTPGAGGPHTIRVVGENEIVLEDVLLGDVWICSGQSNMEMTVDSTRPGYAGVVDYEKEIADSDYPEIRLFDVANTFSATPLDDCKGSWSRCSPETVATFSATGFFFGRHLNRSLGIPIALIGSNWGGTLAEAWTSRETLEGMDDFAENLKIARLAVESPELIAEQQDQSIATFWEKINKIEPLSAEREWTALDGAPRFKAAELASFDGIAWFRKIIEIPPQWVGRDLTLKLGAVDDMDTTFFNGYRVGGYERAGHSSTPRAYEIPGRLVVQGGNELLIRVLDTGGAGGMHGNQREMMVVDTSDQTSSGMPLAGGWSVYRGTSLAELPSWPHTPRFHHNSPTALFNGMIAPLVRFSITGAIWYQGESNRMRALQYRTLFPAMIGDWRRHFDQGDFPFYFVQIAPFRYGGDTGQAAMLREAQTLTLNTPNTGMAVTMDIGNPADIHPKNKQDVGHRLALWALAKHYGDTAVSYSGPLLVGYSVEGDRIRLHFNHVGQGLTSDGQSLSHFTIAGDDGNFVNAQARIDGNSVVVWSDTVKSPAAVRHAWGAADEPNLKNRAGLPAPSFRTDHW